MAQSPVRLEHVWRGIVDKNGNPIGPTTPGNTQIFEATQKAAVTTPGASQLTVADFTSAQGGISAKCVDQGTQTVLRLSGLVPFGVYSLQLVLMGMTGSPMGVGSLSDEPNASIFVADEQGDADISVTHVGGALSVNGEVSGCWLAGSQNDVMQQPMAMVVGNYHFNGTGEGPPGTFIPQFSFTFLRMMRVPNEIRDKNGNQITDSTPPETPVFEFRQGNAVYFPGSGKNRRQLTAGEFMKASGSIAVKCTIQQGTRTAMHLNNLVPGGVYTVWLAKPDPADMSQMLGVGALGKSDGSENHFAADQNGEADIVAYTPGGNLSTSGTIADCWPANEPIVQVAGVYHIDGKTHGPVTGPDGTYAAHFAFVFAKPPQAGPGK
jgi:hypothetical protein